MSGDRHSSHPINRRANTRMKHGPNAWVALLDSTGDGSGVFLTDSVMSMRVFRDSAGVTFKRPWIGTMLKCGWKERGTDVGPLAGKTVRLRFRVQDADVYSYRFESA